MARSEATILPDGSWMILSQQNEGPINNCKDWYIDILNMGPFSVMNPFFVRRKLSVDFRQYNLMTRFALLPDGKTILAYYGGYVSPKYNSGSIGSTFSICLIDSNDFSMQCFEPQIELKEQIGKMTHVNVQDGKIEIEITAGNNSLSCNKDIQSISHYSFDYQKLDLKEIIYPKVYTEKSPCLFQGRGMDALVADKELSSKQSPRLTG